MRNQNVEFEDNVKKGRNIGVVVVALVSAAALAVCAAQIYMLSEKLDAMQRRLNDLEDAAKMAIWSSEFFMKSGEEITEFGDGSQYDKQGAEKLLQKAKDILISDVEDWKTKDQYRAWRSGDVSLNFRSISKDN